MVLSQPILHAQTRDCNAAGIAARMLEADIDAGPIRAECESLRPFDDDDGLLSERVFESERLKVLKVFDAIEIYVVDLAVVVENVDQGERGAGNVLFACSPQAADNALRECGFPAAEFPAQHHN